MACIARPQVYCRYMFKPPTSLTAYLLMLLFLLSGGAASAQPGGKSIVVTERTRAELLAHAPEGLEPGKPVWVGLQLAHQPQWHSYWKNPGDSGLPTKLECLANIRSAR